MRKRLFPIAMGLFSMLFIVSCESELPDFSKVPENEANEVDEWVYKVMAENYLWNVGDSANYDFTLQPADFLKNLINNTSREKYSTLADITNGTPSEPTYDIGFEYGINHYTVNNKTYYVVYYTKPNTTAGMYMKRGDNIISVNDTLVDMNNAETLLSRAIAAGGKVNLAFMRPPASIPVEMSITLQASAPENPVYAVTDTIMNLGVGYLAYNMFNSSYNTQLMSALSTLKGKNINYLVLDLRYNGGGDVETASYLGSALVNTQIGSPFIVSLGRDDITMPEQYQYPIVNSIGSTPIPKLGNQLLKIYVIIGKATSAASNVFINALKYYYGDRLVLVGEAQYIEDKSEKVEDNIILGSSRFTTSENHMWRLELPYAHLANAANQYDYPDGFTPDIAIADINPEKVEMMLPLGNTGERIYKEIIADIKGQRSASLKSVTTISDRYDVPVSIMSKSWTGKSVVEIEK